MTEPGDPMLPDACAVAFKEWAGICDALADGRQSIILRKGGISEAYGRFIPEHRAFWLYPTRLHEAEQGLRVERPVITQAEPKLDPGTVPLRILALADQIIHVEQEWSLKGLEDLHVWTEETILKRFHYRNPGIWVIGVRTYLRQVPHLVEVTPDQAGCKTWVPLPEPFSTAGMVPVLGRKVHEQQMQRLNSLSTASR